MRSIFHHEGQTHILLSDQWVSMIMAKAFDAVIFDCDGTLIDSSDVHTRCLQAATLEQGHEMSQHWYEARNGLDRIALFTAFRDAFDSTFDVDRACAVSIAHIDQVAYLARPIPETIALAKSLSERAKPLAVATNSERPVCELLLTTVKIRDLFDTVVCISDGVPPKPSPTMFQLAAERLDQEKGKVLVIEDSPQGIQAAKAAVMSVIELGALTRQYG